MFVITHKAKNGLIWDGKKAVKEIRTEDAALVEKFKAQGCKAEEVSANPLSGLTVPQLKEYAKEKGIELGAATTKNDIISVISETEKTNG